MATPVPPGPCDWPIITACCDQWDTFPAEVQDNATSWATQILDAATGRRFSQCPVNYRPCGPKCQTSFGYLTWPVGSPQSVGGGMPWMTPFIDAGVWRNCGCAGGCSCRASHEVPFPGPVAAVTEVRVDGVVLDEDAYRLDVYRGIPVLVRIDGEPWPECQDMDADADEVGAFVIVYQPGELLPLAGQLAAGELACEFAKSCVGAECALPQALSSLSRNGVEVTVADPETILDAGRTGLSNVDLWIKMVNPAGLTQRSRVLSSDRPGPRFTR